MKLFASMKKKIELCLLICSVIISACSINGLHNEAYDKGPIEISSPTPTAYLEEISIDSQQKEYVDKGMQFALGCIKNIYEREQKSVLFSPLSMQYALAITANASNATSAMEIVNAIGFGHDINSLNSFCNRLLNQLPALDHSVELKVADAVIVNDEFMFKDSFRETIEKTYYAPIEYTDMAEPGKAIERINEWASRNTNGLIDPLLEEYVINENFSAAILNALYFRSKWSDDGHKPLFNSKYTKKDQPFYGFSGVQGKADYMVTSRNLKFGKLANGKMIELPYGDGKFAMYVVLPDSNDKKGFTEFLSGLTSESISSAIKESTSQAIINLVLPKFNENCKLELSEILQSMGINGVFDPSASNFSETLQNKAKDDVYVYVSSVIQKSCLSVTEWGTEAAAVSEVEIDAVDGPGRIEEIDFVVNRPFFYFISEKSSGVILFEGVYTGVSID